MKKHLFIILFTFVLLFSGNAAYALRCGKYVVNEGDTKIEVLKKCGKPTFVDHINLRVPLRSYNEYFGYYYHDFQIVPYIDWFYNFGPRKFMRRVRFLNGKVVRIDILDRGY